MTRKAIKQKLTSQSQMSEAFILAAMLAFCGGFQDAYTYIVRDKVFANAQTGNVVLMSVDLFNGRILTALRYLIPLSAFAAGIFIADNIQFYYKHSRKLHWRQAVLIAEMLIMAAAGFFPASLDLAANCLISFSSMLVYLYCLFLGLFYLGPHCFKSLLDLAAATHRSHRESLVGVYYFHLLDPGFVLLHLAEGVLGHQALEDQYREKEEGVGDVDEIPARIETQ